VSVYGILDYAAVNDDTGAATANNYFGQSGSILATSRLGFRGTEDLGGGLKASFAIESGTGDGSDGVAQSGTPFTTARGAWVELSGGFGAVRLGQTDLNTTNIDDAVSMFGNFSAAPTDIATASTVGETVDALGNDGPNTFVYTTPSFSGVKLEVGTSRRNSGADNAADQLGYVLSYSGNGIVAQAGRTTEEGAGVAKKTLTQFGVSYNFGMLQAGLNMGSADITSTSDAKIKWSTVSVKVPVGNGIDVGGYYGTYKSDHAANSDAKSFGIIATKALSKRTTGYVAYASVTNESAGTWSVRGTNLTKSPAAGNDPSSAIIGLRHSF
jgi:predicted porin